MSVISKLILSPPGMAVLRAFSNYSIALETNPLRTKALTSGTLTAAEEITAQTLSGERLRLQRIVKMMLYGTFVSGPLGHTLFNQVEAFVWEMVPRVLGISIEKLAASQRVFLMVLQMLMINLLVYPVQTYAYLCALGWADSLNSKATQHRIRTNFMPIMKSTWYTAPAVQVFAMKFLPSQLWVPFFNLVGFVFGVWCNVKAKNSKNKKE